MPSSDPLSPAPGGVRESGSEALMRIAGRIARFAGWVVDIPSRRIVWSDTLFDLLGIERGRTPADEEALAMFEPADRAPVAAAFAASMYRGEPLDVFGTIVQPSGRRIHAHLVGEPEADETGTVVRIHGAFHDITAQVRQAEEQAAATRLLQDTLDQVGDAIAFIDRGWRFTFANTLALELARTTEAEMRERTLWEIFPTASASAFGAIYRDAMERGVAGSEREYVAEWDCWFEVTAHPTDDGIAVIVRDVSDDQESRRRLHEYTEQLASQAALLDAARDAIIVRDLEGTVSYWNHGAEEIYGIAAGQALGRSVRDLLYQDPADFDAATEQLLRDGYWVGELAHRRADGSAMLADCRWQLMRDDAGRITAVFAVNSDITEHRRQEEARHRAQRLASLGTLAGGIAHDLNNVLTPILMTVQLLAADETDERRRELLAALDSAAQRAAAMIKQVLSFARGSAGRREPIDVAALLGELGAFCRETLPHAIALEVRVADGLPPVVGDETELFQVLVNLVTNARDAMPGGGRLAVQARVTPAGVRFEVTDTGHGMDATVLSGIFEPFFTTKESGTGLGLSTSAGIIESHGGDLDVLSVPGEGTTIGFVLPIAADGLERPGGADSVEAPVEGGGRRVLVVDDEAPIRELARRVLVEHGFHVETAEGARVLDLLAAAEPFDAVVTDLMMPGLSGEEVARRVAAHPAGIALVLMSGMQPGPAARKAVERDGASFLPKPFTPGELLAVLEAALSRRTPG